MYQSADAMSKPFSHLLQEDLSKQVQSLQHASQLAPQDIHLQHQNNRFLSLSKCMDSCPTDSLSQLGDKMRREPNICDVPNFPVNLRPPKEQKPKRKLRQLMRAGFINTWKAKQKLAAAQLLLNLQDEALFSHICRTVAAEVSLDTCCQSPLSICK